MALIEKYHVVAAEKTVETGETIKEGQVVALNSSGNAVLQSSTNVKPYGLAGDTKSTSASAMPGISSGWQGRVSDSFDETSASGKITVYHSGGEFATDQFAANVSSGVTGADLYAIDGDLVLGVQAGGVVGVLTKAAGTYPSGVPGVDLNGDQALGGENSNTYIEFKLTI
tara:strand:+ start:39378 stop:39887 length:510 start_codon:yes stop_codon:yes gene_type:complete